MSLHGVPEAGGRFDRRWVPLVGALLITGIVVAAAFDLLRGRAAVHEDIERRLDTQARVVAEQTHLAMHATDLVLQRIAEDRGDDEPPHAERVDSHGGPAPVGQLTRFDARGRRVAGPWPGRDAEATLTGTPVFETLRAGPPDGAELGVALRGDLDGGPYLVLARRVVDPRGAFDGIVVSRTSAAQLAAFHGGAALEPGMAIGLVHRDGSMPLRQPQGAGVPPATAGTADTAGAAGADGFRTVAPVPGYPVDVVVSQDRHLALKTWRAQAAGTVARTLVLALLAALLLRMLQRVVVRLDRARASLAESRERFALAVAGADDGILDCDLATDRLFASERAMHLLGLAPATPPSERRRWVLRALRRVHRDDVARLRAVLRGDAAAVDRAVDHEVRVRGRDGRHRWVRLRGRYVRKGAGRATRWVGALSDIDTLKQTQEALRRSEERYQLAALGSTEGLWDWDLRSDQLFLSSRSQSLAAVEADAPLQPRRVWTDRLCLHPDDVPAVRRGLRAHLRGRTRHFEVEFRLRDPDGRWRWMRQRGVALRDDRGQPYRMAGSIEDVTERKDAEAARERLEQQLRQAQKLEAMGTLAGGIAHDFNNILSAILGYGELALGQAQDGTPIRRYVEASLSAGLRAKSLVERILAFSRSGVGEKIQVNVQSVVAEALTLLRASLPAGVDLTSRLDAGDAAIVGDPTQILQVVMNLCANAVQAVGPAGRIEVGLDRVEWPSPRAVTTCTLAAGPYVRLRVADSGTGIAPRIRERIFDPFFTTKEVGVGTGLGLSLVHGIVGDLGGGIEVDSEVGVGTTMTVYVPQQGERPPAVRAEDRPQPGRGETVLLVDDEPPLVALGEEMLAGLGYDPVGFTSSLAALQSFRRTPERFDLVLTDESMPELTGSELAREVRRLRPDLPILIVTGHATPLLLQQAREIGVAEVLAKPMSSRAAGQALARALRAGARQEA